MRKIFAKIISFYQFLLSPDHSFWAKHVFPNGYCQYYPSCSEYSKQAFLKRGVLKGFWLSSHRVLRCNPYSKGGVDELIDKNTKTLTN